VPTERALPFDRRKKVTAQCEREVARRAAASWGVLSTRELLECGLTYSAISRRRARGWLHPLYRGVWAIGHDNPAWEGRLLAAVKACGPGAVLSHRAAAVLWEFLDREDRAPEVTVPGDGPRRVSGLVVHRTKLLDGRDRTHCRGVPVTAPARTICDLAAVSAPHTVRRAMRVAQGRRRASVPQILEAVDRLGPRRGVRTLRQLLAWGPAPINSVLEDVALEFLLRAGFVHPDVNRPLTLDGRRVIPDFRWPEQRLVLEVDGRAWHDNPVARGDDVVRQSLLEAHGERVLRATWHQIVTEGASTARRLLAAGAPLVADRALPSRMRKIGITQ